MSDERPPVAIGHVILQVGDVPRSSQFFETCGLRRVFQNETMAILELRGGTHLMLFPSKRKISGKRIRNFDLMVDDVPACRRRFRERNLKVSDIQQDDRGGHLWFEVVDPDGRSLAVYSTHTDGRSV